MFDNTDREAAAALFMRKMGKVVEAQVEPEPIYTNAVIAVPPAPPVWEEVTEEECVPYGVVDAETGELVARPVQLGIQEKAMAQRESYPDITNAVITQAVSEVLETVYTNAVINSTLSDGTDAPVRRGPKAKAMQNNFHEYFFELEYSDDVTPILESKVEDVLINACRNTHADTKIPIAQLVRVLRLPSINTNAVLNCLNKTRPQEQWVKERYGRAVAQVARVAIEGMQRLKDEGLLYTNAVFNSEEDAQGYEAWVMAGRPPYTSSLTQHHIFTEEERNAIRAQYNVKGLRDNVNCM